MSGDDPPFLQVDTEVSAKYRGAFCEAKIKKINKCVKCRLIVKDASTSLLVTDENINGDLKVGELVEVKHPDSGDSVYGHLSRLTDCSMYTVVFDDGDERTLRRSQLCLKGDKHFVESETLDNLPLSNPEHFGTPVVQGMHRERKRSGRFKYCGDMVESDEDCSSDDQMPDHDVDTYSRRHKHLVGKAVCVDQGDKKRSCLVPMLVVLPSPVTPKPKTKDSLILCSFKDGKFGSFLKKDIRDFTRLVAVKNEDKSLKSAYEKALLYFDGKTLPASWDRGALLGGVDDEVRVDNDVESSDDEPSEEKDHFVAQLYKFMDDRGTPMNKGPCIGNKDLNLYKLFKIVNNLGGYNKVTNMLKWRLVYHKMNLPPSNTASHQIKMAYKKYLHPFEEFYRKLGNSMGTSSRPSRSRLNTGRSIFRDKDCSSLSPKSKGSEQVKEKVEDADQVTEIMKVKTCLEKRFGNEVESEERKLEPRVKKEVLDKVDDKVRTKKVDSKVMREEGVKKADKVVAKAEEEKKRVGISEERKIGDSRAKKGDSEKRGAVSDGSDKGKGKEEDDEVNVRESREVKEAKTGGEVVRLKTSKRQIRKKTMFDEEPVKETQSKLSGKHGDNGKEVKAGNAGNVKGMKDTKDVKKKAKLVKESTTVVDDKGGPYCVGTKLRVKYGKGKDMMMFEAKVMEVSGEGPKTQYLVHYAGWNLRYDEWIRPDRILSVTHRPDVTKTTLAPPSLKDSGKKKGRPPLLVSSTSKPSVVRPTLKKALHKATPGPVKPRPTRSNSTDSSTSIAQLSVRQRQSSRRASVVSDSHALPENTETKADVKHEEAKPAIVKRGGIKVEMGDESDSLSIDVEGTDTPSTPIENPRDTPPDIKSDLVIMEATSPPKDLPNLTVNVENIMPEVTAGNESIVDGKEVQGEIADGKKDSDIGEAVVEDVMTVVAKMVAEDDPTKGSESPKQDKKDPKTRKNKIEIQEIKGDAVDSKGIKCKEDCESPLSDGKGIKSRRQKIDAKQKKKGDVCEPRRGKRSPRYEVTLSPVHKADDTDINENAAEMVVDEVTQIMNLLPSAKRGVKRTVEVLDQAVKKEIEKTTMNCESGDAGDIKDGEEGEKKRLKKRGKQVEKVVSDASNQNECKKESQIDSAADIANVKKDSDVHPEHFLTTVEAESKKIKLSKSEVKLKEKREKEIQPEKGESDKIDEPSAIVENELKNVTKNVASIVVSHSDCMSDTLDSSSGAEILASIATAHVMSSDQQTEPPDIVLTSVTGAAKYQSTSADSSIAPPPPHADNHCFIILDDPLQPRLLEGGESPPAGDGSTVSNDTTGSSGNLPSSESSNDVLPSHKRKHDIVTTSSSTKRRRKGSKRRLKVKDKPTGSDSDETGHQRPAESPSHHSCVSSLYATSLLSQPRPSKYNFHVEEGLNLEGDKKIDFILGKIQEMRTIYLSLKAEVAGIDRKRKRLRRKERQSVPVVGGGVEIQCS